MSTADDVVQWWDERAQEERPRRFIHPLGIFADGEAYEESGRALAGELAELIGPPRANRTVVDFGAGDGRVTLPLKALGYDVVAVDSSPAMLDRLRERDPNIVAFQSDGLDTEALPYDVDVILVLAVLIHHRHADAARILDNLAATLNPGGRIILDIPIGAEAVEPDGPIAVAYWHPTELRELADELGLELDLAVAGSLHVLRRP